MKLNQKTNLIESVSMLSQLAGWGCESFSKTIKTSYEEISEEAGMGQ